VTEHILRWLHHHQSFAWMAAVAAGTFVLSLVVGLVVVVSLPADYFVRGPAPRGFWHSHPLLRLTVLLAKNLLGWVTFLAGVIMAIPFVPGPGVLFMLVGIGLVDFPGKRSLERRLLRAPRVLASVNRLRARFARPPMVIE
jgi:hypothetical protein